MFCYNCNSFLITFYPSSVCLSVKFSSSTELHLRGLMSTEFGTISIDLWIKGIQVCPNDATNNFPSGDNNETVKMH